jgi:hypothetical protein
MKQGTCFHDDNVKALLGIPVAKPEMGHRPDTVGSPQAPKRGMKLSEQRKAPGGEPSTRGTIKDCYFSNAALEPDGSPIGATQCLTNGSAGSSLGGHSQILQPEPRSSS